MTRRFGAAARWLAVLIVLLAAGLRLHKLDAQSLWNDEGSSYVQALRTVPEIIANAGRDIHPPGYYLLLAGWRLLTGETEFALRSLSALASVLTVALVYRIGARLFSRGAGALAAALVAMNTFSIYYAQEARMYALLALWGAAGMALLVEWVAEKQGINHRGAAEHRVVGATCQVAPTTRASTTRTVMMGVGLALVNAAGLYTQYAYPFVLLAQGLAFLLLLVGLPRPRVVRLITLYALANVGALLLYLPWLPTALRQVTEWPSTGQPIPAGEALNTVLGWFTLGITYASSGEWAAILPFVLAFMLVGLPLGLWRSNGWPIALALLWAALPVALFLLLGLFRPANLKFLLPSQTGFALCVGAAWFGWSRLGDVLSHLRQLKGFALRSRQAKAVSLTQIKRTEGAQKWGMTSSSPFSGLDLDDSQKALASGGVTADTQGMRYSLRLFTGGAAAIMLLALFSGLAPLHTDPLYRRADYRAMSAVISADPRPGDAIILDAPNQEEVFRYYYRGTAPIYPLPPGLGGNDAQTRAAVRQIIADYGRVFVLFWGEAERDPNRVVETTLDGEAFEAGQDVWYSDVRLARYATPAEMPAPTPLNARFGEQIVLRAYALSADRLRAGDVLQARLEWRTSAALTRRYKVFVQLLDGNGVLAAQRDAEPGGNSLPTTSWMPGEPIIDNHGLALPAALAPGRYTLIVGLYDIDNAAARLLTEAGGDYVILGEVTVRV